MSTWTSRDRIEAAVALRPADRVPLAPLLDHFAATYTGISNAELIRDAGKRLDAVLTTMRELGPWDMTFGADIANVTLLKLGIPARARIPGEDLADREIHQFEERELLGPEVYDLVVERGVVHLTGVLDQAKLVHESGPGCDTNERRRVDPTRTSP